MAVPVSLDCRGGQRDGGQQSPAGLGQARVGRGDCLGCRSTIPGNIDGKVLDRGDGNLGAQTKAQQALHQERHLGALAIQQQSVAVREDEKVGQPLALRRQQCGPDRASGSHFGHVVRHQALQEVYPIFPTDLDHAPFGQRCQTCHAARVGFDAAARKKCEGLLYQAAK